MRASLLIVALIALAASAVVASDACGGKDYGTAGDFDFYVFAQSWPAEFCQAHMSYPGCSNPTAWQQVNLTLHGMWPNYNTAQGSHDWPQCCPSSYGSNIDPSVVSALLPALQTYWPNEQDPTGRSLSASLWNHEWGKHGTCSGLDQKTYMQSAMHVLVANPTPAILSNNVGGQVALTDLLKAFNAASCNGGDCYTGLTCSKSGGQQYLSAVTNCVDKNLNMMLCPASVLGSQCSADQIQIQSFNN